MKSRMNKKAIRHYAVYGYLFLIVMIMEICIFNISALRSIGNTPVDKTVDFSVAGATYDAATGLYTADDTGEVDLYTADIGQVVRSIYLGIDFSDPIVSYEIQITDAGNEATAYSMSTQNILQWQDYSKYMTIHTYGEVNTMKIVFHVTQGSTFTLQNITFDPHRPIKVRGLRVLLLYLILCLFVVFRRSSHLHQLGFEEDIRQVAQKKSRNRIGKRIGMGIFILFGVGSICVMNLKFGGEWSENAYVTEYADLAHSLAEGHFYLDYEVSDSLLAMENPYDYTQRVADGVESYWDNAYYDGSYYCYFGVTPVLTVYLPYYLITGNDLNNVYANLIFGILTFLGSVWLVYEMLKKWFNKVPFYTWPLFSTFIGFSINLVYLYQRPDFYDIPIIAGNALVLLGLSCWIHGLRIHEQNNTKDTLTRWMLLGSLCMALVAGCRPQMVLISFLAVPLFWNVLTKERALFSKKAVSRSILFLLPFVLFAAFLMYYNASRFGSPFDFGATYNLTTNDMTKRGFNLDRLGCGIFTFLLQPPLLIAIYPFVQKCVVSSEYMGKMIIETLFGGILTTNLITLFCFGYAHVKHILREKALRAFVILSICMAIGLSFVDATVSGILQRYSADFVLMLLIPGCMIAGVLLERLWAKKGHAYYALATILCVMVFLLLAYDFMVICLQLGDGDVHKEVMTTYYQIKSYFVLQ